MVDLVLHFRKPADWAPSVSVHFWDTRPQATASTWPGVRMTAEDDDWFVHRLSGIEAASLVFNDTTGRQTGNLQRERDGWYDPRDGWHDQRPAAGRPTPPASAPAPRPAPRPSPVNDFREETIYFLMTTRFYDGDPSNNFFCRDRIAFNAAGEATDPHWRGDFKGLIERLDYIRDLGFTAIWITPPVENRSGLDYHGYHRTTGPASIPVWKARGRPTRT